MSSTLHLIDYDALDPEALVVEFMRADQALRRAYEQLLGAGAPGFQGHVVPIIEAEVACGQYSLLGHLASVADSDAVRDALDRVREQAVATNTWVMDNEAICDALGKVAAHDGLDEWDRAWLLLSIRQYEERGRGLPDQVKARMAQIDQRHAKLTSQFSRNLQDADKSWHLVLTEQQVYGMSGNARDQMTATGKLWNSPTGLAADLSGPSIGAIMSQCPDREVRRQVMLVSNARGTATGPGGAACDNVPVLLELLALRHEAAVLSGHADHAHLTIENKMAGTPQAALDLLLDLRTRVRPLAADEWKQLERFAQDTLGIDQLMPWDTAYATERQRRALFDLNAEEVAEYFPLDRVVEKMLDLSARLFDVEFKRDDTVVAWDEAVRFYQVVEHGQVVGGFYLDAHARPGKRQGAWKRTLDHRTNTQAPVATLCLNVDPPGADGQATLDHRQVVTLFHEFGHGLHLLLGQSPWAAVDMGGVERDAIECPSQMMESFAWDEGVLLTLTAHRTTGEMMPRDMIQRLIDSRNHNVGLTLVRQITFALWDLALHSGQPVSSEQALWQMTDDIRSQTRVDTLPEGLTDHMPAAFTHIFSGGYAAGYYGYLWGEMLSADAFEAFARAPDGPVSPTQGARFRQEVLAAGAKRPFGDSFEAFRGRAASIDALLRARGLENHVAPAVAFRP